MSKLIKILLIIRILILSVFLLSCTSDAFIEDEIYIDDLYVYSDADSEWVKMPPSGGGGGVTIIKQSDEIVNNSTTLQDDDELTNITLDGNTSYKITYQLTYTSSSVADMKYQWLFYDAGYNGLSLSGDVFYYNVSYSLTELNFLYGSSIYFNNPPFACGGNNANILNTLGRLVVRTKADVTYTLGLRWAQQTAQVSDTTIMAGSWIEVQTIE